MGTVVVDDREVGDLIIPDDGPPFIMLRAGSYDADELRRIADYMDKWKPES